MTLRVLCACLAGVGCLRRCRYRLATVARTRRLAEEMMKGVGAFKQAQYSEAIEQYIPGADSAENQAMADAAEEQFDRVLELQPDNELALSPGGPRRSGQGRGNRCGVRRQGGPGRSREVIGTTERRREHGSKR